MQRYLMDMESAFPRIYHRVHDAGRGSSGEKENEYRDGYGEGVVNKRVRWG